MPNVVFVIIDMKLSEEDKVKHVIETYGKLYIVLKTIFMSK